MPTENRVRGHDRSDLGEYPVAEGFSFRRQTASLGVGEAKASAPELLLQNSILFVEVLDDRTLLAADPASNCDDEDLSWTKPYHGWMMKQFAAKG